VRVADRLAGLAHGLVGDGAAVDDDPVLIGRSGARNCLALGEIEAAAERDRLDAHLSAPKSRSPLKTCVALPRMRIGCPGSQAIVSDPPGMLTLTGDFARFVLIAATAAAHAPVPQARVRPAPRSHVFRRTPLPSTRATLTLIRCGNAPS